jgi:hypothetical protein
MPTYLRTVRHLTATGTGLFVGWYYFSDQRPDEVLFIRVHDSANDVAPG